MARPKLTLKDAAQMLCQIVRDMPLNVQRTGAENAGYTMEDLDDAIRVVAKETGLSQ